MATQNISTPEAAEKHRAILAQAVRTFAEEGFRNADVQVIADRAGVGKGTVYRYFGNKEDLFWAATFDVIKRLEQRLLASMVGIEGAIEILRTIGHAYCGFFEENPDCLEVFVQGRAEFRGSAPDELKKYDENLADRFSVVFEGGVAAGQLRKIDIRKALEAYSSLLYGSVVFACYCAQGLTAREVTEYAVEVFLEGLRAKTPGNQTSSEERGLSQ